jgi:hypothetical protein
MTASTEQSMSTTVGAKAAFGREYHPLRAWLGGAFGRQNMAAAAEVVLTHDHPDDMIRGGKLGVMIDRHVDPNTELPFGVFVTRDTPSEEVRREGPYISLAMQPPAEDEEPRGGELYDAESTETAHAREWDFLKEHAAKALAGAGLSESASELEKVAAFGEYSMQFKHPPTYDSFHPVDVLLHSSYCTGAANIQFALASVSGIQARSLSIANHSMIEFFIDGRWRFCDNNADGTRFMPDVDYVGVTLRSDSIESLSPSQRKYLGSQVALARSPWHYSSGLRWHWAWGQGRGRGIRTDIMDGYGVCVPFDPHHARALYPTRKDFPFPLWGGGTEITLTEKASWLRVNLALRPGESLRKGFYTSACEDNPVTAARVEWWFRGEVAATDAVLLFGEQELPAASCVPGSEGVTKLRFDLPTDTVAGEGNREIALLNCSDRTLSPVLYPTPLVSSQPLVSRAEMRPQVTTLVGEPITIHG